ncbi:MAG TPA: hypothetical protein VL947_06225 [Cytophagales bacterium]|nr:hypothetical protein [Cytophagales bacterium]
MIHSEHYDKYFPEPGVRYFVDEYSGFILWEGFFDQLFQLVSKKLNSKAYPIEFVQYSNLTGWKEGGLHSQQIDVDGTVNAISTVLDSKLKEDYLACYTSLKDYLEHNIKNKIYIIEHL